LNQVDLESFYIQITDTRFRHLVMAALVYLCTGTVLGQINGDGAHQLFQDISVVTDVSNPILTNHPRVNKLKTDSNAVDIAVDKPTQFNDESDKILISTGFLIKSYNLSVENVNKGKTLYLTPTGNASIGFGFNYKWFGFAFSFGMPTSAEDKERYGETKKQDYRLNLYTNTFVVQGHVQYYRGFHVSRVVVKGKNKLIDVNKKPIIPSLTTFSVGLSSWYFFNHKKFSYKAAYVRNAIQKKSAGSVVGGLYYSLDLANAKTNFADDLPDSIKVDFEVLGYRSRAFGISAGYTQTFVIKSKFFVNLTLVPGIGLKNVVLNTEKETFKIKDGFTGRLSFNFSMGYEAKHFLVGLRAFTSSRFFEANGYRITPTTNSVLLFVGKRFNVNWKKKKR